MAYGLKACSCHPLNALAMHAWETVSLRVNYLWRHLGYQMTERNPENLLTRVSEIKTATK